MNTENPYSHLTAKERDRPSLPVRILLERDLLTGEILDFGCGFGRDVQFLRSKGFSTHGYDPYYFPELPKQKFDTIICFYVLNVLFPQQQNEVLMEVAQRLKPTGRAYFAVRRDIHRDGYRTHQVHGKPTYQCYVTLSYKSIFLNENTEFYEYQHHNKITHNQIACPFCKTNSRLELVAETRLAFAVLDGYPASKGHILIMPKRHVANYFDLSTEEQTECWQLANYTQQLVRERFSPAGFTVGMNVNKAAGQKIAHASIHIIPRYEGDVKNPSGGIRNILRG